MRACVRVAKRRGRRRDGLSMRSDRVHIVANSGARRDPRLSKTGRWRTTRDEDGRRRRRLEGGWTGKSVPKLGRHGRPADRPVLYAERLHIHIHTHTSVNTRAAHVRTLTHTRARALQRRRRRRAPTGRGGTRARACAPRSAGSSCSARRDRGRD